MKNPNLRPYGVGIGITSLVAAASGCPFSPQPWPYAEGLPASSSGGAGGGGASTGEGGGTASAGGATSSGAGGVSMGGGGGVSDAGGPLDCAAGERQCDPSDAMKIKVCSDANVWVETPCPTSTPLCIEGSSVGKAACVPRSCGAEGGATPPCTDAAGPACCALATVDGGKFDRSNEPAYPAQISSFVLDVFEVTVGRFRRYVDHFTDDAIVWPDQGESGQPELPASGWKQAWSTQMSVNDLKTALKGCDWETWTDDSEANEAKPINCVSWYVAFAFCVWDGGRLPTEAEWNYAATGGSEQRTYPWGGATLNYAKANFDSAGDMDTNVKSFEDVLVVGSKPDGVGRWGHHDLAGNVSEWVLDNFQAYHNDESGVCNDCVGVDANANDGTPRVRRGGSWLSQGTSLETAVRSQAAPDVTHDYIGFRCVRPAGNGP